eukprot:Filipodium_phascolosomae@DN4871_c0_g1_i1.p1
MCSSVDTGLALQAVSPLDGRYVNSIPEVPCYFSEFALIRSRAIVEVEWLRALARAGILTFTNADQEFLNDLKRSFSIKDATVVKQFEKDTKHDVKAVEYWLKSRIKQSNSQSLQGCLEFVHFCCTSEDITNLAYGLMVRSAIDNLLLPELVSVVQKIADLGRDHCSTPLLSRTHGQAASPTTFGKEVSVFVWRLQDQICRVLASIRVLGKLNGAVGNFNAHHFACPHVDWEAVAEELVEGQLGLIYQPYTTQSECHDWLAELCDVIARINHILVDFNQDMWSYISRDLIKLRTKSGEVGSSTMPHKVNPIDFENSEGNLILANSMLRCFSTKLPISRLQRDLSDSTVLRNIGVGFGHSILAYRSIGKGLLKTAVNEKAMMSELETDSSWMLLSEPIQTILRKYNYPNAYEKLKELTRGQQVDQEGMRQFIESLKDTISSEHISRLLELKPHQYIGIAAKLSANVYEKTDIALAHLNAKRTSQPKYLE